MRDCTISVIIPSYNVEKYLKAALDSIKAQTELPDEVILIDDGSTDRTLEVANAFELSVPYRVVSIENGGQGNARNLGASLASSEYLHFFDSDDLLMDHFIESIKKQIRQNQYPDIVLFSGKSFNDREYEGNRWIDYCRGFSDVFSDREQFLDKSLSCCALFCSPCLYISKKVLWGPKGLEFGPDYLEDEALFYSLLFSCSRYLVIDEVFFLRRNREGSTMTMAPNVRHVNGALNCMETTLKLYVRPDLSDKERWHIRKRLEGQCVTYYLMARDAGLKCSYKHISAAARTTKNLTLLFKLGGYALRLDKFESMRRFVKMARRLKS